MSSLRIVIVDDDPETRATADDALAPIGAELRWEHNPALAYQRIVDEGADLVLVSADLAGGLATCDRLKGSEFLREMPVVVLTTDLGRPALLLHRQSEMRAEAYVVKPYEPSDLLASVREAMGLGPDVTRPSSPAPPPVPPDDDLFGFGTTGEAEEKLAEGLEEDVAEDFDDAAFELADEVLSLEDGGDVLAFEPDDFGLAGPPPPPPEACPPPAPRPQPAKKARIRQSGTPEAPRFDGSRDEAELRERARELETTLEEMQAQLGDALEASGTLRERLESVTRERDEIQDRYEAVRDQGVSRQGDVEAAQADLRRARAERDAILAELKRSKGDIERLQSAITEAAKSAEAAAEENAAALASVEDELAAVRHDLAARTEDIERLSLEHDILEQELNETRTTLEAERDALAERAATLEQQLAERPPLAPTDGDADGAGGALEALRAERDGLAAARDRLMAELARAESESAALRRQLQSSARGDGDLGFDEEHQERTGELPDLDASLEDLQASLRETEAARAELAEELEATRREAGANLERLADELAEARSQGDDERRRLEEALAEAEAAAHAAQRTPPTTSGSDEERRALLHELEAVLEDRERMREELEDARAAGGDRTARPPDADGARAEISQLERELEAALDDRDRLRDALENAAVFDNGDGVGQEQVDHLVRTLRDVEEERDRLREELFAARRAAPPDRGGVVPPADDRATMVAERTREALDRAQSGVRKQRAATEGDLDTWVRLERDVGLAVQNLLKLGRGAGARDAAQVQGLNEVLMTLHELLQQGSGILQRRKAVEDTLERLLDQVAAAWRSTDDRRRTSDDGDRA